MRIPATSPNEIKVISGTYLNDLKSKPEEERINLFIASSSSLLLSLKLKRPSNAVSSLAVIAAYDDDDTSDLDECR